MSGKPASGQGYPLNVIVISTLLRTTQLVRMLHNIRCYRPHGVDFNTSAERKTDGVVHLSQTDGLDSLWTECTPSRRATANINSEPIHGEKCDTGGEIEQGDGGLRKEVASCPPLGRGDHDGENELSGGMAANTPTSEEQRRGTSDVRNFFGMPFSGFDFVCLSPTASLGTISIASPAK